MARVNLKKAFEINAEVTKDYIDSLNTTQNEIINTLSTGLATEIADRAAANNNLAAALDHPVYICDTYDMINKVSDLFYVVNTLKPSGSIKVIWIGANLTNPMLSLNTNNIYLITPIRNNDGEITSYTILNKGCIGTDLDLSNYYDKDLANIAINTAINSHANNNSIHVTEELKLAWITHTVNNLTNYYTKSTIDLMITSIPKFSIQVFETLPSSGLNGVIYLVTKTANTYDLYDEYIWIETENYPNGRWEKLGSQSVNLTNYVTKNLLNAKQNKLIPGNNIIITENTISSTNDKLVGQIDDPTADNYILPGDVYNAIKTGKTFEINASIILDDLLSDQFEGVSPEHIIFTKADILDFPNKCVILNTSVFGSTGRIFLTVYGYYDPDESHVIITNSWTEVDYGEEGKCYIQYDILPYEALTPNDFTINDSKNLITELNSTPFAADKNTSGNTLATETYVSSNYQTAVSDLDTIRSNASTGASLSSTVSNHTTAIGSLETNTQIDDDTLELSLKDIYGITD